MANNGTKPASRGYTPSAPPAPPQPPQGGTAVVNSPTANPVTIAKKSAPAT